MLVDGCFIGVCTISSEQNQFVVSENPVMLLYGGQIFPSFFRRPFVRFEIIGDKVGVLNAIRDQPVVFSVINRLTASVTKWISFLVHYFRYRFICYIIGNDKITAGYEYSWLDGVVCYLGINLCQWNTCFLFPSDVFVHFPDAVLHSCIVVSFFIIHPFICMAQHRPFSDYLSFVVGDNDVPD